MFRTRIRTETPSLAGRGSVGSARVWDEHTRRRGGRPEPRPPTAEEAAGHVALAADELHAMVAGIVQVTLDTQLADCEPERRAGIARVLEIRLLTLLGLGSSGVAEPGGVEIAEEPENGPTLEVEPAAAPPGPEEEIVYPHAHRALGLVLEDRLERLGGPLAERAGLRKRLVAIALGHLPAPTNGHGAANGKGPSEAELRDLDLLQRRAAKLEQSLREARAALAYVSGLEHVDEGLASIYRVVQGIAFDDPNRERKQGALEAIFQANVALQKRG